MNDPRKNEEKKSLRKRKRNNEDDEEPLDLSVKSSPANQQLSVNERQGCSVQTQTHSQNIETTRIEPRILGWRRQSRLNTQPKASGSSVYRPSTPSLITLIRQQRSHTSRKLYDDVTMETAQTLLQLKDSENYPFDNMATTPPSQENDDFENMPVLEPINHLENVSTPRPTSQENDFTNMPILEPMFRQENNANMSTSQPTTSCENNGLTAMSTRQPISSQENNPFSNMPKLIPIPPSLRRKTLMLNKSLASGTSKRYQSTDANNNQTLEKTGNQRSSTVADTFISPTTVQPDQQVAVPHQQSVIMTPILTNRSKSPTYPPMDVIHPQPQLSERYLRSRNDIQPRNVPLNQASISRESYQPIPLNEFPETRNPEPSVFSQSLNTPIMQTSLEACQQKQEKNLKPAQRLFSLNMSPPKVSQAPKRKSAKRTNNEVQESTVARSRRQAKQFTSSKSQIYTQSTYSASENQAQQFSLSELNFQSQQSIPSQHFSSSRLSLQVQQSNPAQQFNSSRLSLELQQSIPPQQFNSSGLSLHLQQSLPSQQFNSSRFRFQLQQSIPSQQTIASQHFNSSGLHLQLQQSIPPKHFNSSTSNFQSQQTISSTTRFQAEQSTTSESSHSTQMIQPFNAYSSHPLYDINYSRNSQMVRPSTSYSTQHAVTELNETVQNSRRPYSPVSGNHPTSMDTTETISRTRSSSEFRPQNTQLRNDTTFRMPVSYVEHDEVSQYTNSTCNSHSALISNESTQSTLDQFSTSRLRSQVSQPTPMLRTPPYYSTRWRPNPPRLLTESRLAAYNPRYPPSTTINQRSSSTFNEYQQRPLSNTVHPPRMTGSTSVLPSQGLQFMNGSLQQNSSQFAVAPTGHEPQSTTHLAQFVPPVTSYGYWPQVLRQYNSDSFLSHRPILSGSSFHSAEQRHTTRQDDHSVQPVWQPALVQINDDSEDPNTWDIDINKIWEMLQNVNFDLSDGDD